MSERYTATIFLQEEVLAEKQGDDVDSLYLWMLTHEKCASGRVQGKIVDNQTNEIVREFKTRSLE